jgi:ketosteroid isomerase-like protein
MNMFRTESGLRFLFCRAVLLACIAPAPYVVCRAAPAEVPDSTVPDVMAVDRDFAQWALEAGIRSAYDRYLAPDAVMFRPLPVPAREWLATHEPATGRLEWAPALAATACDSSLAVTLGTWTYTAQDSRTADTGHYLTAWRRSENGDWQIVLDLALNVPALPASGAAVSAACGSTDSASDQLLEAERKQNSALRNLRTSETATIAVRALSIGQVTGSQQADLALTHGELVDRKPARGTPPHVHAVYVRVWQRQGRAWRVLYEFLTPAAR